MHKSALTLVLIIGLAAPSVRADSSARVRPSQPAVDDPVAIYRRCVAAMAAAPNPPYASYVLSINANRLDLTRGYAQDGHSTTTLHFMARPHANVYQVWYRDRDRRSLMQDVASAQRTVGPPVPWALDFQSSAADAPAGLAPGVDVGGSAVQLDQATALAQQIDSDQSVHYQIALAGDSTYSGHPAYDLRLSSVSGDPNDHPLRELIVDKRSFRVWQLTVAVEKRNGPVVGSLQLIAAFRPVGRYWLNDSGTLSGEGRIAFMRFHGSYDYSATRFRFPREMPDSYFAVPQMRGEVAASSSASGAAQAPRTPAHR